MKGEYHRLQSPSIQALLHETNKQLNFNVDGQQWFCWYQYAVHNKGQTCPLGSHCCFLPSIFYCMWLPYTLRYTWMLRMAKRKVNFSLSVMLTNKCCVDLFIYSALSINNFKFFTEYKHVKNRSNERKGFLSYDQLVGCWHSNISNKHVTVQHMNEICLLSRD